MEKMEDKEENKDYIKDYYVKTRAVIDRYNNLQNKIKTCNAELDDYEDEFLINFCIHLAHALIIDTGTGQYSRDQLDRICDIIHDVIR